MRQVKEIPKPFLTKDRKTQILIPVIVVIVVVVLVDHQDKKVMQAQKMRIVVPMQVTLDGLDLVLATLRMEMMIRVAPAAVVPR